MPTTASGFWYPDGTVSSNPLSYTATMAASQETAVANQLFAKGVPAYATAALRDAAYSASPVANFNGMQCSVAGVPMILIGGTWYATQNRPRSEVQTSGAQNIAASTWTSINWNSVYFADNLANADFTSGGSGITANFTGRAKVEFTAVWPSGSGTSGFRVAGVGYVGGSANPIYTVSDNATPGVYQAQASSITLSTVAGQTYTLVVLTSIAVTAFASARFQMERVY